MFINGEWCDAAGGGTFEVTNPANGDKITDVPDGGQADAARAIQAAHDAFAGWSAMTAYDRSRILYKAWELMSARQADIAKIMTQEQGKPLRAAMNEVRYGADFLLWYAEEAKRAYGETIPAPRADQRFIVLHQPVGVVAAVTPWNYPASMITRKVAPALAAGCTIVLKPAEATPLCAIEIFKVLAEAGVPEGVANLVTALDPAPIGEEFVTNPLVRKITFTGSTETGKLLARGAADQMKRVSLELGGHAPFLVLKDADPVFAAKGAVLVKYLNTGQACICPNRLFVHKSGVEAFTAEFVARVTRMRAGNGLEDGISIGPLVNEAAIEKVERQVADATSKGAELLCGGHRLMEDGLDRGHFYAPTVLANVTPDMLIYREETFGPVAPIIPFDDDDDILAMANDTHYGLAAYIYTQNLSAAMRTFEGLRFGIVGINDINPTGAAAPFGGMKESGLGREGGHEGLGEYLETKLGGFSV
ncbi:MAG: NAD-dependent succinate-semialdehyde dehydrogenase [Rhodospirillaceae bacterium]|jgi:succinate-semialdehyde dehydrogenase / glutarate-semialdehyde dehydrogenase|nr:NAD-dependent succinate-semialdehyde dehydrogenase [Rhodospirillaceae bacterium]MBT5455381.1 NAD-dependent succinate-semialdehyde dehydrogenase [Rhodospirillaceae bacterium]